jgi:signal transduction histidine kinase
MVSGPSQVSRDRDPRTMRASPPRAYRRVVSLPRQDVLVAGGLLALAQAEVWLTDAAAGQRTETALAAVAVTVPLALRRRRPLVTSLIVLTAITVLALVAGLPNVAFLMPVGLLAMYSLGAHASQERAVAGLGAAVILLPVGAVNTEDATVTDLTAPLVVFVAAWSLGRIVRARRLREGELEDRTARLVDEQEERERAAVADERARIARELHDVVAHRVTTIVVQAESGRLTAGEPGRAAEDFAAIGDAGRQALAELRRLLDVLHAGGEDGSAAETRPRPGVAQLADLVEDVRRAGLELTADLPEELGAVPAGVDLAAYRIAQEGLTNALRHGGASATLRVGRDAAGLHVDVRNPLSAGEPRTDGSGRGLAGLRERARLFGGRLSAEAEDGEFVLHAVLPLDEGRA